MMSVKRILLAALVIVPSLTSCASNRSAAAPSEKVMMERMMAYAAPGAGHAPLAPKVGTWNLKVRMFMSPGAPPMESQGTSTMQWVMDGRFVQDTTSGDFNGMPFHGQGLTGYDNMKKAYVETWIDNMGTAILGAEGQYDEKTRTFHYTSQVPDAMVAQRYVTAHATEKWLDTDHWVMQSFAPGPDGKEALSMEIEYARVR